MKKTTTHPHTGRTNRVVITALLPEGWGDTTRRVGPRLLCPTWLHSDAGTPGLYTITSPLSSDGYRSHGAVPFPFTQLRSNCWYSEYQILHVKLVDKMCFLGEGNYDFSGELTCKPSFFLIVHEVTVDVLLVSVKKYMYRERGRRTRTYWLHQQTPSPRDYLATLPASRRARYLGLEASPPPALTEPYPECKPVLPPAWPGHA